MRTPCRTPRSSARAQRVIVNYYRRDLPSEHLRQLRVLQEAVPPGTIVAPNDDLRFVVAATAWQRLLGCTQWTEATVDAVWLFRGRYIGQGADDM